MPTLANIAYHLLIGKAELGIQMNGLLTLIAFLVSSPAFSRNQFLSGIEASGRSTHYCLNRLLPSAPYHEAHG